MKSKLSLILLLMITFASASVLAREATQFKVIGYINKVDNSTLFLRAKGNAPWGIPGCPSATYVMVRHQAKGILGIALTARALGVRVQFLGTCQDANYFNSNYIIMDQ